jgi:hypothetical protein
MIGPGTTPVARQRATRSGSQTIGFGRGLGVLNRAAGLATPAMMPRRSASLNALRRVARIRPRVASPVGRRPAALNRTHRVRAVPHGDDLVVTFPDLPHQGLHVVRPQLVQDDVAEVRDQMGAHMRAVAAPRAVVHLEVMQPLREVFGDGGNTAERAVGAQALPHGLDVGQDAGRAAGDLDGVGEFDEAVLVAFSEVEQAPDVVHLAFGRGPVGEPRGP